MKRFTIRADSTDVTVYEQAGDGELTVLFLHGVGSTAKVWSQSMRHLRDFGRIVAIDLPGFAGGSALPPTIGDLSDLAPFVCRVLDALGIESAVWVGNSLGGRIAVEACLNAPERVRGLGLICSAGVRLPGVEIATPYSMGEEAFNRRVFYEPERFFSLQSPASRQATLDSRRRYEELMERTEVMDFSGRLHEIRVPTTLIWGRHDGVIPLAIGEAFARGIAGAQLHVLEEAAHAPHLEQPERVNHLLAALLSAVSPA